MAKSENKNNDNSERPSKMPFLLGFYTFFSVCVCVCVGRVHTNDSNNWWQLQLWMRRLSLRLRFLLYMCYGVSYTRRKCCLCSVLDIYCDARSSFCTLQIHFIRSSTIPNSGLIRDISCNRQTKRNRNRLVKNENEIEIRQKCDVMVSKWCRFVVVCIFVCDSFWWH